MPLAQFVQPLQDVTKVESRQFTVMLGLRAAAATFLPLLVGVAFEHPEFQWAGIAGFIASTTDKGGAYATRFKTFLALLIFGSLAVFIGSAVGHTLWLSVAVCFVLVTSGAIARVLGNEAISVGTVTSVMFLIAQATPSSLSLQRAGLTALGIGWAALLALIVWPVRQYAPARKAVAACFKTLGDHVVQVADHLSSIGSNAWHVTHQRDHSQVRNAIQLARTQLAAIRGNNRGTTGKAAWLLGLVQTADQAFGRLVTLTDVLESAGKSAPEPIRAELRKQLLAIAEACSNLSTFATDENENAAVPKANVVVGPLISLVNDSALDALPRAQLLHGAEVLTSIDLALETVTPVAKPSIDDTTPWFAQIRAAISPDSVELRHALRVGLLVALSVLIIGLLDIDHGYWATISMLVVLQPHAPATFVRSLQRVGGTIVGSLLALLITTLVTSSNALLIICAVMAFVSVSVIQVNYALYATLLTPTFLLLAQLNGHDPRLAGIRAGTTFIAGVIALIASRTLWPSTERTRIGDELARAFEALRTLFLEVARVPRASEAEIATARARFGTAIINADVSLQRIVAERNTSEAELEPAITLLLYLRRFCWAAVAITTLPGQLSIPEPLVQAFDAALEELADALKQHRPPKQLSAMGVEKGLLEPLLQGQVERLVQHLGVLADAERRFTFHLSE